MSDHTVKFFENKSKPLAENDNLRHNEKLRKKLTCKNYGIECNFTTSEDNLENIIQEFREHSLQEHNADYPEGILKKSLF